MTTAQRKARIRLLLFGIAGILLTGAVSGAARPALATWIGVPVDTITRQYDVRLGMTGYVGLIQTRECAALTNPAGYDSLIGTLVGIERTAPSTEPVKYTGTLRRKTHIDSCLPREPGWCVVTLTGEARMHVEIEVHEDSLAGAWMKADSIGPADTVSVSGTCNRAEKDQIRLDYPSGESAGTPDGQAIEETAAMQFYMNGIRRFRIGFFPPNAVEGGWGMRVTRVVP